MANVSLHNKYKIFNTERLILFIVLIVCYLVYFQVGKFQFLNWDDDAQIVKNAFIRNLDSFSISHNFNKESFTFITLSFYSVLFKIWGSSPEPFHWFSLIIHMINVILLYQLLKYFTKNIFSISLVLILFALHPMRVESVAWISELKDLLFTFFSLISFLLYFRYLKNNFNVLFFILTVLTAVLAALSKIQGIAVPLLLFLIDFYCKRKISVFLVVEKLFIVLILFSVFIWFNYKILTIGFFIVVVCFIYEKGGFNNISSAFFKKVIIGLLILFSILTILLFCYYFKNIRLNLWSENSDPANYFSFFERILLAGYSLWFYIKNFFFPVFLNAVHPYPARLPDGNLPVEYYLTIVVLVIVMAFSILMIIKRKKLPDGLIFGWFFFLINISLVLHIIPIEGRLVVADRYSYLAYLGLFIFVASICEKFAFERKKYKNVLIVSMLMLCFILSFLTFSRCEVWKNTKTLFSDVISKNPKIPFAYCNIALYYLEKKSPDSAILNYNKAIKIDSAFSLAYYNRAFAFLEKKDYNSSISDFNTFINLQNSNAAKAQAFDNLGKIYRMIGKDSAGYEFFCLAVKYDSSLSSAYNNKGVYLLNRGKISEAISNFEKAIKLNVYYSEAYNNLGTALMSQGDMVGAERNFNKSLALDPNYKLAYDNRGYLKYLNGDAAGAIKDYNIEIQLDSLSLQAYIKRGRAYAQIKNYKKAIKDFNFVIEKEPQNLAAITNRAYAHFYNNDNAGAQSDFMSAVGYYPENSIVYQNIAWFFMQLKNYPKAIEEYLLAIDKDDSNITSYINLAWIYIEIKEYKKADDILVNSLKVKPENPDSFFLLGELYRKKGNTEKSCEFYSKASVLGNAQAKNALNSFCDRK